MKFLSFSSAGRRGLAVGTANGQFRGVLAGEAAFTGDLRSLLRAGPNTLHEVGRRLIDEGELVDLSTVTQLPPIRNPGKIICIGLNYRDHAEEARMPIPTHPTVFSRFPSSLIGHEAPIVKPVVSSQLDFEAELAIVVGKDGRHIRKEHALDHVAGYSLFNDASIRDVQLRTTQWTLGKNFDATGAFGPVFVTADSLPAGAKGLRLLGRLNGETLQDASTDEMIFDVATLVSELSATFTLEAGDVIITGTPAGVGMGRIPPVYMKAGDVFEVEIAEIGVLRNTVVNEA